MPWQIAIMASGTGTHAERIYHYGLSSPQLACHSLIIDNPKSPLLEKAKDWDIDVHLVVVKKGMTRQEHEEQILAILKKRPADWILLAGYRRLLTSHFISQYKNRLINIHPSLLPAFPGMGAYEKVWQEQAPFSGATVHYVDEGMDTGPILFQEMYATKASSYDEFFQRGMRVEYKLYQQLLKRLELLCPPPQS